MHLREARGKMVATLCRNPNKMVASLTMIMARVGKKWIDRFRILKLEDLVVCR